MKTCHAEQVTIATTCEEIHCGAYYSVLFRGKKEKVSPDKEEGRVQNTAGNCNGGYSLDSGIRHPDFEFE